MLEKEISTFNQEEIVLNYFSWMVTYLVVVATFSHVRYARYFSVLRF